MGREGSRRVSPQTQKPNSAYGNGQTNFHYNPIKNAPFSYLKYKNFSAGRE
jgi:hypothetical protein